MREHLVETSSIFSNNKQSSEKVVPNQPDPVEEELQEEEQNYCKTLQFKEVSPNSKISLQTLFPDSLFCVILNNHSNLFFAGHLQKELIYEVPIEKYNPIVVTDKMVVLEVWLLNDHDSQYMILEGNDYSLERDYSCTVKNTDVNFNGRGYSRLSTEVKPLKYDSRTKTKTLFYEKWNLIQQDNSVLISEDTSSGNKLLFADASGSYIGFYLPINEDGTINLHGRKFEMVSRLTLTVAIVIDSETGEQFILTCLNQLLISLKTFGFGSHQQISTLNGIALLLQETESGTVFNVFTPNHQRIILEPKYKISDTAVGNGLYFEKDNVLLLDNGSLIFTERIDEDRISVRGSHRVIPTSYIGDI